MRSRRERSWIQMGGSTLAMLGCGLKVHHNILQAFTPRPSIIVRLRALARGLSGLDARCTIMPFDMQEAS